MKECEKIFGEAELDESYFGAYRKRGYHGKLQTRTRNAQTAGVWYFETQRDGVFTEIIPNCKKGILYQRDRELLELRQATIVKVQWSQNQF